LWGRCPVGDRPDARLFGDEADAVATATVRGLTARAAPAPRLQSEPLEHETSRATSAQCAGSGCCIPMIR